MVQNMKKQKNEPIVTKKERKKLLALIGNTDWSDEDSVWNLGVELGNWSVKIRGEILRRNGEDMV